MLLPLFVQAKIQDLASRGDTGTAINVVRGFAQGGWAGPIAEVIDVYSKAVQVNGSGVRNFLAGRVPGILANNYYNLAGQPFYNDWIEYTLKNPRWGDPIRDAAASGSAQRLEDEVQALGNAVIAWVRAGKP